MTCGSHERLKISTDRPGRLCLPGRRRTAAVLLATAALLAFSGIALAHAAFVRSEPAPNSVLSASPGAISIWFSEPVEPRLSRIDVLDAARRRMTTGEASLLPGDPKALSSPLPRLSDGTYTVVWRSFSTVDGHPSSGSFVFSVGVPAPAPAARAPAPLPEQPILASPAEPVARWLGLLGILALLGCLVFELFVSQPVLASVPAARSPDEMQRRMDSRTFKLTWSAAIIFAMASAAEPVIKTSAAYSGPPLQAIGPMISVLQTGWGNLWLWRMAALMGMITVLAMASLDRRKRRASGGSEWQIVTLAIAAGILLTISLASHGAAVSQLRAAAILSDYLHLLAAAVWVGGIIYLGLIALPVMKSQRLRKTGKMRPGAGLFCPESHVMVMSRFSTIAIFSVATLLATGLYSSWAQVSTFSALATPYGVVLLIKLGLILPLLALGAVNRLRVRPRLPVDVEALTLLHKTVTAEAVLAVFVLLSVGTLTSLEPARQVVSRQEADQPNRLVLQQSAEDINVRVTIGPGTVGPNLVTVVLTGPSGRPVAGASAVTLQFSYLDSDIGTSTENAVNQGGGVWLVPQAAFNIAGNWRMLVVIRRPDAFDARTTFQFQLPSARS